MSDIFIEDDEGRFILEEEVPLINRIEKLEASLDKTNRRLDDYYNKLKKCCDSPYSSGRNSPYTTYSKSPKTRDDILEEWSNSFPSLSMKKGGKRKTIKKKNKKRKIKTRRYKK
jgi:hypothetical protein